METELNIANILKDKPSGTKLYADAFGELSFKYISNNIISTRTKEGMFYSFYNDGKYDKNGEPILVPSKEMCDWNKFAWKKGDVLVSNDYGTEVIFYDWYDNTYTNFYGKHYLNSEDKNKILYYKEPLCATERYSLEDRNAAQTYINTIEERLGGKLNLETLEIEKQIMDLKPKIELKPFDKVLVRDGKDEIWEPAFFFRNLPKHNVYKYQTVGGKLRVYCIPFNEETAKLIGTSNDWEE